MKDNSRTCQYKSVNDVIEYMKSSIFHIEYNQKEMIEILNAMDDCFIGISFDEENEKVRYKKSRIAYNEDLYDKAMRELLFAAEQLA